jgi:regulator of protease activity HflC (stomatin/prohibitin superfamily)
MIVNQIKLLAVALVLMLVVVFMGRLVFATRIQPGYVGIKVNTMGDNKGVEKNVTDVSGLVWHNPFTSDIIQYPTFVQDIVYEDFAFSVEGQPVSVNVGFNYSVQSDKASSIYIKYRKGVEDLQTQFLQKKVREGFNTVAGKYKIDEFLMNQPKFMGEVKDYITKSLNTEGFNVDAVTFTSAPTYNDQIKKAITAKINATQKAETLVRELEQTQASMEKLKAQAEGEKQARITEAQGKAEATLIQAKADAEAIKLRKQELTAEYIEFTKASRWDGVLPQVSSDTGIMLNLSK